MEKRKWLHTKSPIILVEFKINILKKNIYNQEKSDAIKDILNDQKKLREVAKVAFDSVDTDRAGLIDHEELEKVKAQISQNIGAEPPTKEDVKIVLEI